MHNHDDCSLGSDEKKVDTALNKRSKCASRWKNERGAAAVEFAIILFPLMLILFGITEFGRAYEVKVQLTGGVREGARALALGKTPAQAIQAVKDAAPDINYGSAAWTTTACPADGTDGNATVKVSLNLQSLTIVVPSGSINITATGVMRCGL